MGEHPSSSTILVIFGYVNSEGNRVLTHCHMSSYNGDNMTSSYESAVDFGGMGGWSELFKDWRMVQGQSIFMVYPYNDDSWVQVTLMYGPSIGCLGGQQREGCDPISTYGGLRYCLSII